MNIYFNEQQKNSLEEMASKLGTTQAVVLRKSLSLLKLALRERKQHNQIAVVRDGKVVKEIEFSK